jgi:molybdopterin/thiamine biosynthesis adenylyltransferase
MGLVLLVALVILGLGYAFKVSNAVQASVLAVLLAAVLIIQVTLPAGNGLRVATGGSLQTWLIFLGVVGLIAAYILGLKWVKRRVPAPVEAVQSGAFSAHELERYARHIVLREIGGSGQQKLKKARVLVIGAGGLGSPALLYLAAAGVGTIGIVDDDAVSLSNLQRQVLHIDKRIGMPKVFSAEIGLKAINPHVEILPFNRRLTAENAAEMMQDFDLVLDGSDNFSTRYLVNATCVALGRPLISAAISQWEGQISLFDPATDAPCYACVFPEAPADGLAPSCAEAGVMGALPGVVGSMMAVEAIKFFTGAGQVLKGEMLIYDALYGESRKLRVQRRDDCKVCGGGRAIH